METFEILDITLYSFKAGGKILDQGGAEIKEAGLLFGLTSEPTVKKNLNKFIASPGDQVFNIEILDFDANTTYYVRSYGINEFGVGYGNEVKITSPQEKFTPKMKVRQYFTHRKKSIILDLRIIQH